MRIGAKVPERPPLQPDQQITPNGEIEADRTKGIDRPRVFKLLPTIAAFMEG